VRRRSACSDPGAGTSDASGSTTKLSSNATGTARNLARTADRRFEDMVSKGPDCWLWTGSVTRLGYGQFGVMVAPRLRRMIPCPSLRLGTGLGGDP
jgi:hypothetical protein